MKTQNKKNLLAALEALQLWFASLPYGYSEQSQANADAVAIRAAIRDRMIERLAARNKPPKKSGGFRKNIWQRDRSRL